MAGDLKKDDFTEKFKRLAVFIVILLANLHARAEDDEKSKGG